MINYILCYLLGILSVLVFMAWLLGEDNGKTM